MFKQFEREISSLDEQLEDLEQIRSEVEDRSDDDGRFIYSTIVDMIQMLKERYTIELKRRKGAS
jgi:chaperonin cofactor prefoldin